MTPAIPRHRIILAAMVPFIILALVGLGLTSVQTYKVVFWDWAEATYVGSTPVILTGGGRTDHSYSEVHYRFTKRDGSLVLLHYLERASSSPREKTIAIRYNPSVEHSIARHEGSRWDRASSVSLLLTVGVIMSLIGLVPCLVGAGLLFREFTRGASPPPLPPT